MEFEQLFFKVLESTFVKIVDLKKNLLSNKF